MRSLASVVCQIAKQKGCYVIGSAGSREKMNWLVNNAGVDYAFNYKELRDENISKKGILAILQKKKELTFTLTT
jgi:NADPH-dependent curcumin reductase CurA